MLTFQFSILPPGISVKNVLRVTGIAALVPGIPLIIAPAAVIAQVFAKGDGEDTKTEYISRGLGVASSSAALMQIAQPTRDLLHVKIFSTVACLASNIHHRTETAEKGEANKLTANIMVGLDAVFLIALLLAKKNDDDESGKPWHSIIP